MRRRLPASVLKTIALITMFIDHLGMTVVMEYEQIYLHRGPEGFIAHIMRIIGAIAFILYAFLLSEGFSHTSDKKKYALRLAVLAVISEVPYDLANEYRIVNIWSQNIFFTLLIGYLTIWAIDELRCRALVTESKEEPEKVGRYIKKCSLLTVLVILLGMILAEVLRTDYGLMGVAIIVTFYLLRGKRIMPFVSLVVIYIGHLLNDICYMSVNYLTEMYRMRQDGVIVSLKQVFSGIPVSLKYDAAWRLINTMPGAVAALLLICFYNGAKGRQLPKAFYYLFYPVHLLLLYFAVKMLIWR